MIFENFSADSCIDSQKENFTISYFGSLQYLQTVAFTIGYGHITPMCHLGKVGSLIIISKIINSKHIKRWMMQNHLKPVIKM